MIQRKIFLPITLLFYGRELVVVMSNNHVAIMWGRTLNVCFKFVVGATSEARTLQLHVWTEYVNLADTPSDYAAGVTNQHMLNS